MPVAPVTALLDRLLHEPGRPRLTWYGDDGERVELSGAVLGNWVSKTVNLLVEEFDAGPGTAVALDLPVHWRTAVWALATWRCGAAVVVPDAGATPSADVVVTDRPAPWADHAGELVVVSLPALARRFDGSLPAGAIDAASAVMTYGDVIGWVPDADPAAPALAAGPDEAVPHADLVPALPGQGERVLVDGRDPVDQVLRGLLAVWAGDGSVVLTSPGTAAALETDAARRDRLVASERVTSGGLLAP
ncbi:TIGR03089 family protein [Antribacter gilvus]|uniref:TIGR03089 family protein n=1 Tax=Antribacter gilvus TaxID=2304675 RepID=UPI000F7955AE|nr:TIGR03089 family protein [Antribacter gilvus]